MKKVLCGALVALLFTTASYARQPVGYHCNNCYGHHIHTKEQDLTPFIMIGAFLVLTTTIMAVSVSEHTNQIVLARF